MFPKKYLPEDKIRQKICQSSPELRLLAAKLEQVRIVGGRDFIFNLNRQAYINKERAAQLAEKNLQQRLEEEARDKEIAELVEQRQYYQDLERKEYLDQQISKLKYQHQLDEQLKIKEEEKRKVFQRFLEEKDKIDEIVRRIKTENEIAMLNRLEQKQATKQQIREFKESQIVWREMEENKIREENKQIQKFIEQKEIRDVEFSKVIADRRKIKNEQVLRLAEDIRKNQEIAREKEEILFELQEGRKREEEMYQDQLEMEETIKRRLRLREANEMAALYRNQREAKERDLEEKYRQMMLDKFAEDDKIEQMNAQRRRMKREEHKRAVQVMLEERRIQRENEKLSRATEIKEKEGEEMERRRIIEEERLRMLRQNVEKLVGHIPKGILSEEDIDALGGRLKTIYKERESYDPFLEFENKYTVI